MQPNIIERVWRQDKLVNVDVLNGFTFTDEEEAHRFIISGKNVNTPVNISGTITANFKNANNVLVPLTGTIEDGKAVVVLSRECYAVEDPFSLMIFADTVCIYAAIANVINSSGEVIAYPTAAIPDVHELIVQAQEIVHRLDNGYDAFPTLTVGPADVLTVTDGADDIPLKTLSVAIEPKQDLHGYDKPWVGGSGKNLIKAYSNKSFSVSGVTITTLEDGSYLTTGTATETIEQIFQHVQIDPTKDYYISGCPAGGGLTTYRLIVRLYHGNELLGTLSDTGSGLLIASGTQPTADNMRVAIWFASGYAVNNLIFKPMAVVGNTATSFEPWENICPITGYDSLTVSRTDINLYDKNEVVLGKNWVGGSASNRAIVYFPIEIGETYNFKINNSATNWIGIIYGETPNNGMSGTPGNQTYSTQPTNPNNEFQHTATNNWGFVQFQWSNDADVVQADIDQWSIIISKSGVETVSVNLSTVAGGTVYGGTLTINSDGSGTVVVDRAKVTLTGNESLGYSATTKSFYHDAADTVPGIAGKEYTVAFDGVCDRFAPYDGVTAWANLTNACVGYVNATSSRLRFSIPGETAVTDAVKAKLAGTEVVYKLATHQSYTLTATQLRTLLGNNTLWCDAGQVEMEYRRDTGLALVEERDGMYQQIRHVMTMFTGDYEDDFWSASKNYAVGDIVVGSLGLFRVTSAITTGTRIRPGTNCTPIYVIPYLKSLM